MEQFIFLDESGDLGFGKLKSSKYFVISIVFISDKKPLEKIVINTHRTLRKTVKRIGGGVLHSYKEKPVTRKRLLDKVNKKDCSIMTIYLKKEKVYTKLRSETAVLYNYVVNILLDRIMTREYLDKRKPITLVASKRETNKFLNQNFKNYLSTQVELKHKGKLNVIIKTPSEEKSLQATDFICWAIFRKYEFKDSGYYEIIKDKIIEERGLFE